MNITLVIASLQRGGAERVLSILANGWSQQGKQVTLITFDDQEGPAYPIEPRVKLESLSLSNERTTNVVQAVSHNFRRVFRLRRAIRRSAPDVVICFLDFPNIITLLATRGLDVPVIVSERCTPEYVEIKSIWKFLRRKLYPHADALVCPTQRIVEVFQQDMKAAGYAIANPVEMPDSPQPQRRENKTAYTVVAMGRLCPQKGFDLLLEAFSRIAKKHPEWSLKIMGSGPLRNELEAQAKSLGLQTRVNFTGAVADPFTVLQGADMFVLSSRFEGFPNALTEAMARELPVISFDCPTGPAEIIRDGVDGILVPAENVAGLAAAMDNLMSDAAVRATLASRAPEVVTRFSLEKTLDLWEELFTVLLQGQSEHAALKQRNTTNG